MSVGCLLDARSFYLSCKSFIQHSTLLRDDWNWVQVKDDDDEGYMKKTLLVPGRLAPGLQQSDDDNVDDALEKKEQVEDDGGVSAADVNVCDGQVVVQYEYHVLYSSSYQVPVLCFRASALNGRPLTLQEVWDNIHPNYTQRLLQRPWDTLTQQEHPLLGQPFFTLHPCRTEEFMKPVLEAARSEGRSVNYMVLWLSVMGPVVGLNLPLSYSTVPAAVD